MRSNSYTLIFTTIVTVILGFFLSLAVTALKDRQSLNVEIDIKKNILRSLDFAPSTENPWTPETVQSIFEDYISSIVINANGETIKGKNPADINSDEDSAMYPVYIKTMNNEIDGYAIPISGKGLWSTLYGYFAVESDGLTVKGITFYKHGETPGLGGEVEKPWFQNNFKGKKFVDNNGKLVGVQIIKGNVDETSIEAYHQVDGISGATMTTKGLNNFLMDDLKTYESFFSRIRTGGGA
ncbi:MAG: NADH:ubiquinone reductase (Na(+)-transporting) subunit C [Candidatus Marinimicrobia bacterium]|jgi:Na+-transporting NADH:ubiquinone oxidoreductase subunit C|nr:NADH:ubiquinone reductase (Na(+)-transporting) subunit C [Candidatus Neomarinimicrobiota bacterium]MDP6033140.1 NADH:ubiquinone reductase (Na(+)-transporting) subunit C [Candidatus Neomarinimicrobiota bacterium]MDP7331121.1 NADH:ubiquinone reductase (Na(+)-transporting) subunit C [Candidatus Neomarinimicrobiota bacterium]MDP7565152.1 NADH:ubiquinone reductase (Na(+)-transporting) subunit C [Candidatus Neomarinimicrobiota bacterium]|tara:strand:- start:1120 stop:1836 length:717 start_codon:yes stop_codon:yes gene_type:complete